MTSMEMLGTIVFEGSDFFLKMLVRKQGDKEKGVSHGVGELVELVELGLPNLTSLTNSTS